MNQLPLWLHGSQRIVKFPLEFLILGTHGNLPKSVIFQIKRISLILGSTYFAQKICGQVTTGLLAQCLPGN